MSKRVVVTQKQKAAAALSVKRSTVTGRYVSKATQAIANAQPRQTTSSSTTVTR